MIAEQGLRVFSRELFEDRIREAGRHGKISDMEQQQLLKAHMYATGEHDGLRGNRAAKVCLVLSDHVFDDSPDSVRSLLTTWGGEGIFCSSRGNPMNSLLRGLGKPAIAVVSVPVLPGGRRQLAFPDLAKTFVGARRGMRISADLHRPAPVPPEDLLGLWRPGDAEYAATQTSPTGDRLGDGRLVPSPLGDRPPNNGQAGVQPKGQGRPRRMSLSRHLARRASAT